MVGVRSQAWRGCFGALAWLLASCGGDARRESQRQDIGAQGGSGSGAGAAAGAEATTPPEPVDISAWPWFLGPADVGPGGETVMSTDGVLTLDFQPGSERLQLQTHQHFDLLASPYSALSFSAWANRPVRLIVAITGLTFDDYWTDLEAGRPWLAAEVEVGLESKAFEVRFDTLSALGPGTPRSMTEPPGTVFWFLIEDADSLGLRLANIRLQ